MSKPPKSADWFLGWFCREELLEEVRGDLHEFYELEFAQHGAQTANWRYWYHVLLFLRPFAIRKFSKGSNNNAMLRNNIKLSWRNMVKHKRFAFIHIFGLVMGITSCLFILAYVQDEKRVDQLHKNKDRVFRVDTDIRAGDTFLPLSVSSGAMGPAMKNDFPEVETFVRISKAWDPVLVGAGEQSHFEEEVIYADEGFFQFFGFQIGQGLPDKALDGPGKVIISKTIAQKYFSNRSAVGEQLMIKDLPYEVTAVLAEDQHPSHLNFDMLLSFDSWTREFTTTETNWGWSPTTTYLLLNKEAVPENLEARFPDFVENYMSSQQGQVEKTLMLQSLDGLYFSEARLGDIGTTGNKKQLYLLLSAAMLIIVLALSNFINLSSARAAERMKEVGVRKVLGAHKQQLISQFFTEAVLFSVLSLMISMAFLVLLWPSFSHLIDKELVLEQFVNPITLIGLLGFAILLGIIAGSYPALILSSFKPVDALKKRISSSSTALSPKKLMLGFQFFISMGLLIVSIVMWEQFRLIQNQELGFYKDQKIVVDLGQNPEVINRHSLIRNQLLNTGLVSGVTFSSHIPGQKTHSLSTHINQAGEHLTAEISLNVIDMNFIEDYGLELVAGRAFSADIASDTSGAVMLNETAVLQFGFNSAEEAIGASIAQWGREGRVIGVVRDFNQESLHKPVEALSFQVWPDHFRKVTLTLSTNDFQAGITGLSQLWGEMNNGPFSYSFLDERLDALYAADQRFGKIFRLFTFLSLFITTLGLLGFATYMVKLKVREMAIRKVLGAKPIGLLMRLVKLFSVPGAIAFFIAPVPSYFFLKDWLGQFAYRVQPSAKHLVFPVLILLLVVLTAVLIQSIRAIRENPVNSLRNE